MVLVQGASANGLVQQAEQFLRTMKEQQFDAVWDTMMTYQAKDLLSHSFMPIHYLEGGHVDTLLDINHVKGLALGFQMNHDGQRTEFFRGVSGTFIDHHWYELDHSDWMVFATDDAALAINGSVDTPFFVPFVKGATGQYVIDWEAYLVFSMVISSSKLFEIGTRALVYGHLDTANLFFRYSAQLAGPLERLERLALDQIVVQQYVTDVRRQELESQKAHSERAQEQIAPRTPKVDAARPAIDATRFVREHFKRYAESADLPISDSDMQVLDLMSDSKLRKAIAEVLVGVDKHQARREAGKVHGPAELADIVVDVTFDGRGYSLCMPFKTGREMRSKRTVPESMVYQIWRPHMFLASSIVVFITARPCSQNLWQDIRQSKDRMSWSIEVIEHEALARLLKANGRL